MMTPWIIVKNKLAILDARNDDKINLDLIPLVSNATRFNNMCIETSNINKCTLKLFEAITYLENNVTILKSLIEPHENELISRINERTQTNDFVFQIDSNFDRLLSIIDGEANKIKDEIDDISIKITNSFATKVRIKKFREKLMTNMNDLILRPLQDSVNRYSDIKRIVKNKKHSLKIDGKETEISERKLFEYILFLEVFKSSKTKGSPIRQKSNVSSGTSGSTFTETNIIKPGKKTAPIEIVNTEEPPKIEEIDDFNLSYDDNF